MLRNDGFYMAELILSLAGWLLIAGILMPFIMQVKKQTIQIQQRVEALHLLSESIQTVLIERPESINRTVEKNGIVYQVVWLGEGSEVCITYEDIQQTNNQYCWKVP